MFDPEPSLSVHIDSSSPPDTPSSSSTVSTPSLHSTQPSSLLHASDLGSSYDSNDGGGSNIGEIHHPLKGDGLEPSRLSRRYRSLCELLPRIQSSKQRKSAYLSDESLATALAAYRPHHIHTSSDSLHVNLDGSSSKRFYCCRSRSRRRRHRRSSSQKKHRRFLRALKKTQLPATSSPSATLSIDVDDKGAGGPDLATPTSSCTSASSCSSTDQEGGSTTPQRRRNPTRRERIEARLHGIGDNPLLYKGIVVPVLALLAVPAAVLTCPICAYVVARNSWQAG
ncbi:uncharacterized protein BKCO1_43000101 [Diplodia corticola]|uniref:Uncharacterized protein n=1 Tax=Diplodia corticola TaxID=236234 RepID=A0A1J9QTV4_9PEZI|nr:uncharacterized protein BKCO1_43000101 [Diplodia corticola]OJD31880.1 hypothetical protein BKCO1_43000101 [Diplodia corticola]